MSATSDAKDDLEAAAATVTGIRAADLGESLTPPAFVVGPPILSPAARCYGPREATFSAYLVVDLDEFSMERLWELTPLVWTAIEENTPAVVTAANPGTYTYAGSGELPCYELVVEYPLGD